MAEQVVMANPHTGERTITNKDSFEQVWAKKSPAWELITDDQTQFEDALNGEGDFPNTKFEQYTATAETGTDAPPKSEAKSKPNAGAGDGAASVTG